MIWNSFSDFWAMGGYAVYVWGSFGLTFGLMALEMVLTAQRQRAVIGQARERALSMNTTGDWQS